MEMRLERRMELFEMEEQRYATRAAVTALAAIALAFTGVVASATVIRAEDSVAMHALATAPLPLSVFVGAWAYRLRRRLGEIRGRKAEIRSAIEAHADEDPFARRLTPRCARVDRVGAAP